MELLFKLVRTLLCVNLGLGTKTRMVCEELDDIFNENRRSSECIPGPRGPVGPRGEMGPPGPPGPVNEVALERLQHGIAERTMSTEEKLANLTKRLSLLEEKFVFRDELLEICDFFYKSKCFFLLMPTIRHSRGGLPAACAPDGSGHSRTEMEATCSKHGGHLANIYDRDHFEKAKSLIRSRTVTGYNYNHVWTGMKVDIPRRGLRLSTGEWAPYQGWYPNRPFTPARAAVGIHIDFASSSANAGMFDEHETCRILGGLCERSVD